MSALLVPVLRVPSSLLVPVVCLVFFCLLHMYNKSVLQYNTVGTYIKNDDHHEPRSKFHLR